MEYVLSEHGTDVANIKVEAIRSAGTPEIVAEVRSFLGFVKFTGRFIPDLATMAEPLNRLLREDQQFVWESGQTKTINTSIF